MLRTLSGSRSVIDRNQEEEKKREREQIGNERIRAWKLLLLRYSVRGPEITGAA